MSTTVANLISALAVGFIIAIMASLKNPRLKATVYSLPIPISIALLLSNGKVTDDHIIGLFLLTSFLWGVYYMHQKLKLNILVADLIASFIYICFGYFLIKIFNLPILFMSLLYLCFWLCAVYLLFVNPHNRRTDTKPVVSPVLKGSFTTIIAYGLFSLKNILSGLIVTFPFSGVFAVIETRRHLADLARVFTRNSIAILFLLVTVALLRSHTPLIIGVAAGWYIYLLVLTLVVKIKV